MAKRAALATVPALLLTMAVAAPASAQTAPRVYNGMNVDEMLDLLLLSGLEADSERVDGEAIVADRRITVDDFSPWYIYFYNCLDSGACQDMEFRTAWSGADPALETINAWNARNRFTRAWRSPQGFAVLSMDVNADGGVTAASILTLLPLWRRSVARFANSLAEDADD